MKKSVAADPERLVGVKAQASRHTETGAAYAPGMKMHLNDIKNTNSLSNFPAAMLRRFRPELAISGPAPVLSRDELRRLVRDMVD
ncbi:hypothetical protein [Novosphingobium olei]|uniref:hypothetical protein n=1 Tax=Novosphingobium olei TaxID=2728851 RepID=UPI0030868A3A|nr:hypothetical protein NSDW_32250 [Novosphingobium olei]